MITQTEMPFLRKQKQLDTLDYLIEKLEKQEDLTVGQKQRALWVLCAHQALINTDVIKS